jgi:formamidopyrimidine-DNA glycosylase
MPELPEVETIARTLREGTRALPGIVGKTITGAEVFWDKTVAEPAPEVFRQAVLGQVIQNVGRRAKYLVITLDRDTLLIHLRMSGDVLVGASDQTLAEHVRLKLELDNNWQLAFNNPRKFGRVWLLPDPDEIFSKLGPEPLDPALKAENFWQLLQRRKRQIKPLLLDQGFIAGMGNIYTDEALNMAKIHPQTRADQLTAEQAALLLDAMRQVLRIGIQRNGASIDWVYRGGEFQNYFRVYQRTGEPCPECGTPVERIVVGQRGTHFCPECQGQ